ncbi:MAG: AN1-type zinc finger domain-containing protein [Promethearchaeota archaeon]
MPFCVFCGEEIGYLPFKCKYCGGTFCKKHRLPENHECTFELKHISVVPTSSGEPSIRYREEPLKRPKKPQYEYRIFQRTYGPSKTEFKGTKFLIFMIVIFSIVAFIFSLIGLERYIFLSLQGLVYYYTYYTLFTALFISSGGLLGLFILMIMMYFLYNMTRYLEMQYGTKFLINLYISCALFSAMIYILLRLLFHLYYPIETYGVYVGLAWGGIFGILSFTIFPYYNRKMTGLMYFIPIRVKGRTFLLIIILIWLIPGLIYTLFYPLYVLYYIPDLGGILAAYLIYYNRYKVRKL